MRKSLGVEHFALLEKYVKAEDGQEPTAEVYAKAIEAVKADESLPEAKKEIILRDLGASKRRLERQALARRALGL